MSTRGTAPAPFIPFVNGGRLLVEATGLSLPRLPGVLFSFRSRLADGCLGNLAAMARLKAGHCRRIASTFVGEGADETGRPFGRSGEGERLCRPRRRGDSQAGPCAAPVLPGAGAGDRWHGTGRGSDFGERRKAGLLGLRAWPAGPGAAVLRGAESRPLARFPAARLPGACQSATGKTFELSLFYQLFRDDKES